MQCGNGAMVPLFPSLQLRAVLTIVGTKYDAYIKSSLSFSLAGDNNPSLWFTQTVVHTLPTWNAEPACHALVIHGAASASIAQSRLPAAIVGSE